MDAISLSENEKEERRITLEMRFAIYPNNNLFFRCFEKTLRWSIPFCDLNKERLYDFFLSAIGPLAEKSAKDLDVAVLEKKLAENPI